MSPAAVIHHTEEGHFDGVLSDQEMARARAMKADLTVFKDSNLATVYNPGVLTHERNIHFREHTRSHPEDEMEWMHGEDWRDWLH